MKHIRQCITCAALFVSLLGTSHISSAASQNTNHMHKELQMICFHAAKDHRMAFQRGVANLVSGNKMLRRGYKKIADGLLCNGKNVADFARQYGAVETVRILVRHASFPEGIIEIRDEFATLSHKDLHDIDEIAATLR